MGSRRLLAISALLTVLLLLGACNTQKNTARVRWWKGFKTRYNTYFNAHQAYLEGMQTKLSGNKDNYTDILPLLMVGNESSQSLGKSNFETTVTKCEKAIQLYSIRQKPTFDRGHKLTPKEKEFRQRKEYNPFLKNAWILMGKAQLEQGDFVGAAATFAYTIRLYQTQPNVANVARALMALCYTQLDWFYDAEEALNQVQRNGIGRPARKPFNAAQTNYYLRQQQWELALPYLEQEVHNTPHGAARARIYFLLAQVYQQLGQTHNAYKAYAKCLRQSPPYELKFNARIAQTEVMEGISSKRRLRRLRSMARNENNKDYLDRIYYAIGNVYLAMPDTLQALDAYEKGLRESTQAGPAKGQLLLQLGDVYWAQHRFGLAQNVYSPALPIIGKEHSRYREIEEKTRILSRLAPYTDAIYQEDSLQALVRMPEEERLAAIDRLIEKEKERQKELRKAQNDSIAAARNNSGAGADLKTTDVTANTNDAAGTFYFYSQQTVTQGAATFKKQWGNRKNEDDWRRSTKTTVTTDDEEPTTQPGDTLAQDSTALPNDTLTQQAEDFDPDAPENNPLRREYYLKNLPFTPEQMAASNEIIREALLPAGIIEKDELENYDLARQTLLRLYNDFPDDPRRPELLYQLFLLFLRWGQPGEAEQYRNQLATYYPDTTFTLIITAPDFEDNARYGRHWEDSIYTATYEAFRINDYETIEQGTRISQTKYPQGANRAKFMFIEAMQHLRKGNQTQFLEELGQVATMDDPINTLALAISQMVSEGRVPGTLGFNLNSLWARRDSLGNIITDSIAQADSLTANRFTPWLCILPYSTDSISENNLIYEVARFNFTHFNIRSFELEMLGYGLQGQLRIQGFQSFDEAYKYTQDLFNDSLAGPLLQTIQPVLISEHNLQLVGLKYTIEDYLQFYQDNFLPLQIKENIQLDDDNQNFIWDEFQEVDDNEYPIGNDDDWDDDYEDGGEWY